MLRYNDFLRDNIHVTEKLKEKNSERKLEFFQLAKETFSFLTKFVTGTFQITKCQNLLLGIFNKKERI